MNTVVSRAINGPSVWYADTAIANGGVVPITDNCYNLPPDHVALLCLKGAKTGGVSGLVSFATAHE